MRCSIFLHDEGSFSAFSNLLTHKRYKFVRVLVFSTGFNKYGVVITTLPLCCAKP